MPKYPPPFSITPQILRLIAEVSEAIGRLSARNEQEHLYHPLSQPLSQPLSGVSVKKAGKSK